MLGRGTEGTSRVVTLPAQYAKPMRLLVLGGTSFVGRAVVEAALARGWRVTTFNRGLRVSRRQDVETLRGDRLRPLDLAPLADRRWDAVIDTWSGAPRAVRDSAHVLASGSDSYLYVSSRSVYAPPPLRGQSEDADTVESSPDADEVPYPEAKRGGELAVLAEFGERALLARAGLILGPYEDVGRLPWWLLRMDRGGRVLAPGPPDLPLQYVDARDLARWLLDAAAAHLGGAFNLVSRRGHATMAELLEACQTVTGGKAQLIWAEPAIVAAAGIEAWTELPIWLPPDHPFAALHDGNVERAFGAGLRCRPVVETVADTWAWLQSIEKEPPIRPDRDRPGLDPVREQEALALVSNSR